MQIPIWLSVLALLLAIFALVGTSYPVLPVAVIVLALAFIIKSTT